MSSSSDESSRDESDDNDELFLCSDTPSDDSSLEDRNLHDDLPTEISSKMSNIVSNFCANLRPQMLNLMNEFADAEMFLIDGDSLLLEMLCDSNLDWCYGGQFLHLVYLCERYLHLFVRKAGVFQLVFFQEFQELWKNDPSMYLARQTLKIHFREHIDYKVLCDFQNPWDPAFEKYIQEFCPSFILLSDGNLSHQMSSRLSVPQEMVSKVFLCQLDKCLSLGMNCAFTSGIEFGTSTLNGYHIMSTYRHPTAKLPHERILNDLRCHNEKLKMADVQNIKDTLDRIGAAYVDLPQERKDTEDRLDRRFLLHMAAATLFLKSIPADQVGYLDLVRVVLLHSVLLTQLPLKYRALSPHDNELDNELLRRCPLQCFTKIQYIMSEFLDGLQQDEPGGCWSKVSICDVWDGRMLFTLLYLLLNNKLKGEDVSLSSRTHHKFVSLVSVVSSICERQIEPFPILSFLGSNYQSQFEDMVSFSESQELKDSSRNTPGTSSSDDSPSTGLEMEGLIKLDCPLLNEYAGEILDTPSLKKRDAGDVKELVTSGPDFNETYHWHSGKPLSDMYERTKENKQKVDDKKHAMKMQGKYATYMQKYGASLLGEKSFKPIVVEDSGKRKKKEKSKSSKKSLGIIEDNIKKKEEETSKKEEQRWDNERKQLNDLVSWQEYETALDKVVNLIRKFSTEKVIVQALLMKAKIYWKKWQLCCDKKVLCQEVDTSDAQSCFLTIRELTENHAESLKTKEKITLSEYLVALGFIDIALKKKLMKEPASPSAFERDQIASEYSLNISSSRFQLQSIGDQLKRETGSNPDRRVDNFIPDTWQTKLLDAVDNKQSALIVAPTSSGKTFASYYCMEQILKEDNEGVVVYVSPTKALVNQVAATCDARYQKAMPPGRSVYGVFTRDYRHNALNSQILVTVPQCLEILLLSPARQDWVAKIKYVIFDEVHCLGSEIGAEYWEHLLLLIRSPFLALSATVRNPEDLHKWLQTAEDCKRDRDLKNKSPRPNSPKSYEVALVKYDERYNDLEKFNYAGQQLNHIHPCAMLTVRQLVQSSTFPAHVSLSPRETLAFYDAMVDAWPEKDAMEILRPENHFTGEIFITKPDARRYETALKSEFMTWVTADRERTEMVIKKLGGKSADDKVPKRRNKFQEAYNLLEQLDKNGDLPVIFFSYDRSLCERFVHFTVRRLILKQRSLQAGQSNNLQLAKSNAKQARRVAKLEKRSRDQCEDGDEVMRKAGAAGHKDFHKQRRKTRDEQSCFLFDNPPDDRCSYAGRGVLDREDAQFIMRRLRRQGYQKGGGLTLFEAGLRRGVSFHHSGMSARQRGVVEMLFRKKFLRVVFATGTLALGIHMPCKTVVFAGDSVFLNSLQYHQISGRAGRRGFDFVGNVIFLGVPRAKIQRLMTVNLPRIIGNFPLNVTLVLRLLLMVNKVDNRETAMNQVLTLLQNPLICMDQPELDLQLKHHFLFSVELLARQGLLDVKGNPQGLAGLATHLHYHEPANLVLVTFLQRGLFNDFCRSGRSKGKFSKDFLKSLIVILSHLFARRKVHDYTLSAPRSTSKVLLENLPPSFEEGLTKYNNVVHAIFDLYLRTVAVHVYDTMGEDVTLPLSGTNFIGSGDYNDVSTSIQNGATLEEELKTLSQPYKACSAFAALSGNTDCRLYSSEELISNIRYQVYTDIKVIPILHTEDRLNAYALDFFNHGNVIALTSENGLMHGDVFNLLKDFLLVIKSIKVSLTELAPEDGDDVIAAFTQLAEEYGAVFRDAFGVEDV